MDSIRQEDNMNKLIKDLSSDELMLLVKTHMYEDLAPVHNLINTYVSERYKVVATIVATPSYDKKVSFLNQRYLDLMDWAEAAGREPLWIVANPLGIFEFNLDLLRPNINNGIASIATDKGAPILSWYPEFDSEDAWINAAMEELSEVMYVDPAEADLEMLIEDMIKSDIDYDKVIHEE